MDNENTLVTHVLGGSRNNIKHVEVRKFVFIFEKN